MNLSAERRDYAEAGSLADEVPYWGWLRDKPYCITRSGELVAVAQLSPAIIDGRTPDQFDQILNRWQRLLSSLDPHTRFYFFLFRRAGQLEPTDNLSGIAALSQAKRRDFLLSRIQDLHTYVAWAHDPHLKRTARSGRSSGLAAVREWFPSRRQRDHAAFLLSHVNDAAERFAQLVEASAALVADLTPLDFLQPSEATAVFSELVNRPGLPWHGQHIPSALNWRIALSELEAERNHLRLDGQPLILYSMLSPPVHARANLLQDLYTLDADALTISLEWRPYALDSARRKIRSAQRHYFTRRYSMVAHAQDAQGTVNAMVDSAAEAESDRLASALVELEADGIAYGDLALTVAIHGDDLERVENLDADVRRIFGSVDAKVIREGYGQLPAWWARLPAQPRARQVRSVFVSAGVAACLAPLFGPPRGTPHSAHLRRPSIAVYETPWRTPYHYDLYCGDVGHTLVLGATGSGKSFALNFILVNALRYNPRVLVLDLGGSYKWLTEFIGGSHLELNPDTADTDLPLKPFALPATERTFQFLTGWITRLLHLGGYQLSGGDTTELRTRIEDVYHYTPENRTLAAFVHSLPKKMWPAMDRWHEGGAWARFFDHPATDDDLQFHDWQVIDLAGAAEHPDLCEAALFYLLERLRLALDDPAEIARVKLMVVDEAWRYLNDPAVLAYLAEAAKTWRKRNAALILATQSAADITNTPGAQALLESMPTKLFLANPDLPDSVADTFRLNRAEMKTIRGLIQKREIYLRRAQESAILRLDVDPESYWLYTSSPIDSQRRAAAVAAHGLAGGLAALANNQWRPTSA